VQNTSLRTAGILTAYTTHVTGTVTRFGESTVAWLLAVREPRGTAGESGRDALMSVALWSGFLLGAAFAAFLQSRVQALGFVFPLAIVLMIGVVDLVAPLAKTVAE
jgi:uncharacterized membrane protein YoaK (UPF0700 family)